MIVDAERSSHASPRATKPTLPVRLAVNLPIALALAALLLVQFGVIQSHRVSSVNMMPTLEQGDHVMVRAYGREPARGDVVVYRSPFDAELLQLGRIVGMPGNRVSMDERGLTVDGHPAATKGNSCPATECPPELIGAETIGDRLFYTRRADGIPARHFPLVAVPDEHYFVLSDNRIDERDSRIYGPIPYYAIVGVLSFVYYASGETGIRWDRISRPVS
jgi:signal peptidase I